jgi:SAM-dependent methyltransferase
MKWLEQNGRLSKFPLVLDVGCSQNHGLIKLASDSVWRRPLFRPIAATRPLSSESVGAAAIEPDALATHRLNALLGSSLTFGYGIGVDIAPMHHPDVKKWARSNSFYPKELLDIDRVEEYDTLDTIRPQNVSFMELDFLKPEQAPYLHNPSDDWHGFQVVMMSTVLHQLSAEDRVTMLDVAKRCVRPDGIIVVQDFAHLDPADPSQLVFYERWNDEPYRYRTFIIDMQDPGQLQEVFVWDSGRCRALQIGLGRLATGGGRTNSFHDILGVVRDEVA